MSLVLLRRLAVVQQLAVLRTISQEPEPIIIFRFKELL